MPRPLAALLLVTCAMIWGFAFIAQKSAMGVMGPLTFTAPRYLLGGLVVVPLALREYRRRRAAGLVVTPRQWRRIGILSLVFFFGVWLQQAALATTTVTNGGFLTALYVLFTPLAALAIFRLRPHPIVYAGAPMALVGIYLLTGARLDHFTAGDGMLVLCAVCWAVQVVLLGELVRATGLPIAISAINYLATAGLALAGAVAFEHPSLAGIADAWIEILYTGLLSTAVAFTLQAIGQQYVPASNAAIILSAESLFAALGGAVVLGERLPLFGYAGAALIFCAILMVETVPNLRRRPAPPAASS